MEEEEEKEGHNFEPSPVDTNESDLKCKAFAALRFLDRLPSSVSALRLEVVISVRDYEGRVWLMEGTHSRQRH